MLPEEVWTIIKDIKTRNSELDMDTIEKYSFELSAHLVYLARPTVEAEGKGSDKRRDFLLADPKASVARAEVLTEATTEYKEGKIAKLEYEAVSKNIDTLKSIKRKREDEQKNLHLNG